MYIILGMFSKAGVCKRKLKFVVGVRNFDEGL